MNYSKLKTCNFNPYQSLVSRVLPIIIKIDVFQSEKRVLEFPV